MAMTIRYDVLCACRHMGKILIRENDTPYSKGWEEYSLKDLNGSGFRVEGFAGLDKAFETMKPTCLKCGSSLASGLTHS